MGGLGQIQFAIAAALVLVTSAFFRLLYILPSTHKQRPECRTRGAPTRLLIVLGSGGHTSELLWALRNLDVDSYTYRSYLVSDGDDFSHRKAVEFEQSIKRRPMEPLEGFRQGQSAQLSLPDAATFNISIVPRARRIHQSLLTTPLSAFRCLWSCYSILRSPTFSAHRLHYPDLVLTNGPGTAVCVVLACLSIRFCGLRGSQGKMRTIYLESWARVRGLSLTGKILVRCVDRFLVQWEELRGVGGQAEYLGVLV